MKDNTLLLSFLQKAVHLTVDISYNLKEVLLLVSMQSNRF